MQTTQQTHVIDIARRLGALGQKEDACRAYTLALGQLTDGDAPEQELEAALYLFQNGGDYKVAYTTFYQLYNRGYCQEELLGLMTGAFYEPNAKQMKTRYEKNCKLLQKYPYLFRKDFLPFEELPIRFFPFDDKGYLPFDTRTAQFGEYTDFRFPRVTRNFFKDLENPILADDVFSSYEMHYLNDNVRKSEWVGRENHIYLHYTDWETFCAHLQVWNLRTLLTDKKIVFLIENEISQYPIDFKARFGIDYSQYPVEPIHIREVNRLIWHTQLSSDNGGDFFNEIFDEHPNLIALTSCMMDGIETALDEIKTALQEKNDLTIPSPLDGNSEEAVRLFAEIRKLKNVTKKDMLVFLYLCRCDLRSLDKASRITPVLFLQPHFPQMDYILTGSTEKNVATLSCEAYENIRNNPLFLDFPYIKTFTPMRRFTTSYAATLRFMYPQTLKEPEIGENGKPVYRTMPNTVISRVLNRSFMIDWQDRLFQDSVLVRFEDAKLNPKATFTALAAFLDLPYTESMTYCSFVGQRDPLSDLGNTSRGFDTKSVYNTYDEYAGTPERYYLEYFLRDAYEYYGYDFHYYDGAPVDLEKVRELSAQMTVQDRYSRDSYEKLYRANIQHIACNGKPLQTYEEAQEAWIQGLLDDTMRQFREQRVQVAEVLMRNLRFVNKNGQPLHMMPKLELDPALLEQPLYH